MPLSKIQNEILRLLAAHRDPESYVAGSTPLTRDTSRYSADSRTPKLLVAARLDRDVYDWLKNYGDVYSTRINHILRAVMSTMR